MEITGVWLKRVGEYAVVEIESHGAWIEVIREHADGNFSHIVEESGMRDCARQRADELSYEDLRQSGGIINAP